MTTDQALQQVREAIRFQRDDHHRNCGWRKGRECDCYNRFVAPYHEALDQLAADLTRKTEALREIVAYECDPFDPDSRDEALTAAAYNDVAAIARAALNPDNQP